MKHLKTFESFLPSFDYDEKYLLQKMSKGQFIIDDVEENKIYFTSRDKGKWVVKVPSTHNIEVSFCLRKSDDDYYLREMNKLAERKINSEVGRKLWYYLRLKMKKTNYFLTKTLEQKIK